MPTVGKYNADQIYHILEEEMVSLKIKPGEMLSENQLCERFEVSRTIIRTSLQRLEQKGFVKIIPRVGTRVTVIDLDHVTNFIYLRTAVESRVLHDFISVASQPELEELRFRMKTFEKMVLRCTDRSALTVDETNQMMQTDLNFHRTYFHDMGKDIIWSALTQPHPNYSRFIRIDMLEGRNLDDVLREHQSIMQAVDERNADAVDGIISAHLNGGIRRLGPALYSGEYSGYFQHKDQEA